MTAGNIENYKKWLAPENVDPSTQDVANPYPQPSV